MMKKYVIALCFALYAVGCKSPDKEPVPQKEIPVEFQLISDEEKQKRIERQIQTEKDSIVRLLTSVPSDQEKQNRYAVTNRYRDFAAEFMRKTLFKDYLTISVRGTTGSGYRKIYFPPLKDVSFYPPKTVIVCENLDPESGMNLNYEVMIRTQTGWEFYVMGHDLELTNNAAYYKYPADCVTCHYDKKVIEPMYSFSRYVNKQNPITKQKIEFDGFLSRDSMEKLTENKNTIGLFGPYYELLKGAR